MVNIILIGLSYSIKSIEAGFLENGVKCYSFIVKKPKFLRLVKFSGLNPEYVLGRSFKQALEQAIMFIEIHKIENPKILVLKGFCISNRAKKYLTKKPIDLSLWTFDSLTRNLHQAEISEFCKFVFVQDMGDLNSILLKNEEKYFLPLGFDKSIFAPEINKKVYDIALIGNLSIKNYSKRLDVLPTLNALAKNENIKIIVVGSTGSPRFDKDLKSNFENLEFAGRKSLEGLADLISKSKIALNIHQDDGNMPVNPMTFAIPACKTLQIVDDRPYLNDLYSSKGIFRSYKNLNDLKALLIELLNSKETDYEKQKELAYDYVVKNHSYKARAHDILSKLNL